MEATAAYVVNAALDVITTAINYDITEVQKTRAVSRRGTRKKYVQTTARTDRRDGCDENKLATRLT